MKTFLTVLKQDRKTESGLSLLELLFAMLLLSILTATASANLPELMSSFTRNSARQQLDFDIQRARQEAAAAGARAIVTAGAGGSSYTFGLDFMPFSNTGTPDNIVFVREVGRNVTLAASQRIIFDSRGYLVDALGALTSTTLTLSEDGSVLVNAIIYPTGVVHYSQGAS